MLSLMYPDTKMGEARFLAECLLLARADGDVDVTRELERRLTSLDQFMVEQMVRRVEPAPAIDSETAQRPVNEASAAKMRSLLDCPSTLDELVAAVLDHADGREVNVTAKRLMHHGQLKWFLYVSVSSSESAPYRSAHKSAKTLAEAIPIVWRELREKILRDRSTITEEATQP